jgi:DNA-binding CsgD family transcriptional regulator
VLVTRIELPRETAPLTKREREVLARIAAGMTSKEIAADLGVSLRTVGTHREHLAKKLSTSSVAAFVRYAIHNGIVLDAIATP